MSEVDAQARSLVQRVNNVFLNQFGISYFSFYFLHLPLYFLFKRILQHFFCCETPEMSGRIQNFIRLSFDMGDNDKILILGSAIPLRFLLVRHHSSTQKSFILPLLLYQTLINQIAQTNTDVSLHFFIFSSYWAVNSFKSSLLPSFSLQNVPSKSDTSHSCTLTL